MERSPKLQHRTRDGSQGMQLPVLLQSSCCFPFVFLKKKSSKMSKKQGYWLISGVSKAAGRMQKKQGASTVGKKQLWLAGDTMTDSFLHRSGTD